MTTQFEILEFLQKEKKFVSVKQLRKRFGGKCYPQLQQIERYFPKLIKTKTSKINKGANAYIIKSYKVV